MTAEDHSSRKRSHGAATEITCTHRRRRSKLTPLADCSSTSEPSTVSNHSTLMSTGVPEDSTDATDAGNDSDTESELSESSEEPSSDSSSDDDSASDEADSNIEASDEGGNEQRIVNLRANRGKKPRMKLRDEEMGVDLRPWLKEFLPKLKAANEELEREKQAGTLKDKIIERDGDEGQYIEMDLGLGVLKERDPNAEDSSSSSDSDNDEEEDNKNTHGQPSKKKDVMDKLLGRQSKPVSIEEVGNGKTT
ncbi:hypothetical protein B0J11DRAFT_585082 [Dendryphion nanum]|uniref:Uncharacterized protein n=1 Tax=Dendryphion nanum TaxID=256645 RepID=A0A9P9D7G9_9PLEO|nr:hypothetical protein B0J11DRAFT_585082 [Dendryphion nanum]